MRQIYIANDNKRDAQVGMEGKPIRNRVTYSLPCGLLHNNIRVLKTTISNETNMQLHNIGVQENLGNAIIALDPEVDIETAGMIISGTKKVWLTSEGNVAFQIKLQEILRNPDGTEKDRRAPSQMESNILSDLPLLWSGKAISKSQAVRRFAFTRKFQLRHLNGITYDFLYGMASELHKSGNLMMIGGGKKGIEPLVVTHGGKPYRGFLEGRIEHDKYALILHLTNIELKNIFAELAKKETT